MAAQGGSGTLSRLPLSTRAASQRGPGWLRPGAPPGVPHTSWPHSPPVLCLRPLSALPGREPREPGLCVRVPVWILLSAHCHHQPDPWSLFWEGSHGAEPLQNQRTPREQPPPHRYVESALSLALAARGLTDCVPGYSWPWTMCVLITLTNYLRCFTTSPFSKKKWPRLLLRTARPRVHQGTPMTKKVLLGQIQTMTTRSYAVPQHNLKTRE